MDNEILKIDVGGDDGKLFISGDEKLRADFEAKLQRLDAAIGENINNVRWEMWNIDTKASQNLAEETKKREDLALATKNFADEASKAIAFLRAASTSNAKVTAAHYELIKLLNRRMQSMANMIHYGMMSIAIIVVGCATSVWALS